MPVNLQVDFAQRSFDETVAARAHVAAAASGYRLVRSAGVDERLAAWIDWTFGASWWSQEARRSDVWFAFDASGEVAGFAAFDARGLRFPWLRAYDGAREIGIFGPYGVAPQHRKTGLGAALLDVSLAALQAKGYARALIPAVGFEPLIAMYRARTGASIVDTYSYAAGRRFRAVILASGSGTNAQNVFERVAAGSLDLEVAAVITNFARAGVLARARAAGVGVDVVEWERAAHTRPEYDARVAAAVAAAQPDIVLLLGWMHLLPPAFIERFPDILNLHPAFLPFDPRADTVIAPDGGAIPAFRGAHALRDAVAAGSSWVGASVHRVTAETDRGAIVVRTPLKLEAPERAAGSAGLDALAARLRPVEHAVVAAAIRRWCFEQC